MGLPLFDITLFSKHLLGEQISKIDLNQSLSDVYKAIVRIDVISKEDLVEE